MSPRRVHVHVAVAHHGRAARVAQGGQSAAEGGALVLLVGSLERRPGDAGELRGEPERRQDRPGEGLGLGGRHGQTAAASRQLVEELGDAREEGRLGQAGLPVVVAVARDACRSQLRIGAARGEQCEKGVPQRRADEAVQARLGLGRQAVIDQRRVQAGGDGPTRVHQDPIEIEDDHLEPGRVRRQVGRTLRRRPSH